MALGLVNRQKRRQCLKHLSFFSLLVLRLSVEKNGAICLSTTSTSLRSPHRRTSQICCQQWRKRHRSRRFEDTLSSDSVIYSVPNDRDGNEEVSNPHELRKALQEMMRTPSRQSPSNEMSSLSRQHLADLNDAQHRELDTATSRTDINRDWGHPGRLVDDDTDDSGEPEHGGWFLDENEYIHSNNHVNPDGSLNLGEISSANVNTEETNQEYQSITENLLRMQAPDVPSSLLSSCSSSDSGSEPTLETLLGITPLDPNATSQVLHRQVFEHEDGFLNQSEVFRKSLGSEGSDAAMEAARLRRGAGYRQRQAEAISKLDREIADFEVHLNHSKSTDERCSKCGCALSQQERQWFRGNKAVPASRRICSVCYADVLVGKSDRSFFRHELNAPKRHTTVSLSTSRRKRLQRTRPPIRRVNGLSPPLHRQRSISSHPDASSRALSDSNGQSLSDQTESTADHKNDDIKLLKQEIKALQDEVRNLKHVDEGRASIDEAADDEGWQESTDEGTSPWSRVIDPDTGEVFYWNEETEEMTWEL